ncbi:MAG: bifunctional diaminohydroxyphosphoribosylaminopyrimidine deaminase/5-amino-6-(5-phosphoribosylamino)uracil reductase RibD [Spirochaetales bacterium]|nr:bifunctional diaminohydroxyphosphoribosylaminopyrimidine deaminase/5-amino-6-(5-phosphoribosylamino)uracil reductase RibD [Spirochaetales bacterium]
MNSDKITDKDILFMKKTLALAKRGEGMTSPNPAVGAILVKNEVIVGQGFHKRAGTPHAEVIALLEAGKKAEGSTLYVNLEPCCHYGKTPPCVNRIIQNKIKRVVIGMKDPNPLVNGKGIAALKKAGISVLTGVLETDAKKINEIFCKYITGGLPFVTMKAAITLDGKIASYSGSSRWITGEASRKFVHKLRFIHDAVMVGIGTVLNDDPLLTCRFSGKKEKPISRIIVDSRGRIPLNARVLNPATRHRTIIASTTGLPERKYNALEQKGAEIILTESDNGRVNILKLFTILGQRGICSVFLEGGGTLNSSIINNRLADKLFLFIAPKIIGGKEAPTWVEGKGIEDINAALMCTFSRQKRFGDDIMLEYYFNK